MAFADAGTLSDANGNGVFDTVSLQVNVATSAGRGGSGGTGGGGMGGGGMGGGGMGGNGGGPEGGAWMRSPLSPRGGR